jgi:cystathionine beta-lyase/cystathionine gamma-synthase
MTRVSLSTLAVHAGERGEQVDYTPICTPIHNAVTYTYGDMRALDSVFAGQRDGYVYTRFANPTVSALERAMAELEGTDSAVACASGMAAVHLALLAAGVAPGRPILAAQDLYGGTTALLNTVLAAQGVTTHTVDVGDQSAVAQALRQYQPAAVLLETISNPLLRIVDIPALASLAHEARAKLVVDNTFATPCIYCPTAHGADYVVHSATKYLGGHGDATGGIVATSSSLAVPVRDLRKLLGNILGPQESWLILRGLKTLALRLREQCANASLVARFLESHPRVSRVFYPGLPSHPQFILARRLFSANLSGAMVSFEISGAGQDQVFGFMDALRLIVPATSLGDVTTLALYPAHSSHRALSEQERERLGISAGLVRLSLGIEDASDIIADLAQALAATPCG